MTGLKPGSLGFLISHEQVPQGIRARLGESLQIAEARQLEGLSGRENSGQCASSVHVDVQGIDSMQFAPYHQAERLSQGIVPFFPLFGSDSRPDVSVIHKLAQGRGLKDLGFGVQGDVLFVVKWSG